VIKKVLYKILSLAIAVLVFVSSTGFVSVQHFCNMTDDTIQVQSTCACNDNCEDDAGDNCVKNAACCYDETNYLINAVPSLNLKTIKNILALPVLLYTCSFSLVYLSGTEKYFSVSHKLPPLIIGKTLLQQKSLLLV